MKKVISIIMVLTLLLNAMGYYGFLLGLKYTHTVQITQRLNNDNYSEAETITLKVPLAIPYYGDTEYERAKGEIEHNGEFYQLVKQKIVNDTLYVVCIPDVNNKRIHHALTQYVKTFSDQSSDHNNLKTIPSFIKDYVPTSFSLSISSAGWSLGLKYFTVEDPTFNAYLPIVSPPPEG